MKLTYEQVQDAFGALTQVSEKDLPLMLALDVALTLRVLRPEAKMIDELRTATLRRHAKTNGDGQPLVEDGRYILADQVAFEDEWKSLLRKEIEVELQPIKLARFSKELKWNAVGLMFLLDAGVVVREEESAE